MQAIFTSDWHLQPSLPQTTLAFFDFLENQAVKARRLYLLGDIFEFWVGDDTLSSPYLKRIAKAIRHVHDAGTAIFWMGGNRDFLVGKKFARLTGSTLLPELFVTHIAGHAIVMSHGDAQCTNDKEYIKFRTKMRSMVRQKLFLLLPQKKRLQIVTGYRKKSQQEVMKKTPVMMDVNPDTICELFEQTGATVFIHGHTHKSGKYIEPHQPHRIRYVLSDWNLDTAPARGGWLEIHQNGEIQEHCISHKN